MAPPALRGFLDDLLGSGAVTAAAAVIGGADGIESEGACGVTRVAGSTPVSVASLFDLASLTKPVTATVALRLDALETLPLRTSVGKAIERAGFGAAVRPELARKSLGSLLRHRAGFVPWTPLFARCASAREAARRLVSDPGLLGAAPSTYSDLGYILWSQIAERVGDGSLPELVERHVARPLGLESVGGPPGAVPEAVACYLDNARERDLAAQQGLEIRPRGAPATGTVQDGNARFLGTSSGHAGLFGSARAVWRFALEWARPRRCLTLRSVGAALRGSGPYVLGWRRRPREARDRAGVWYGHLGFTGGGVWFSPEAGEVRVLLAHRSSVEIRLQEWRKRFLELAP